MWAQSVVSGMKKQRGKVPLIPVAQSRYPVIYWYCADTKAEKAKADKVLDTVEDVFELHERLRTEIAQLMRECAQRVQSKR